MNRSRSSLNSYFYLAWCSLDQFQKHLVTAIKSCSQLSHLQWDVVRKSWWVLSRFSLIDLQPVIAGRRSRTTTPLKRRFKDTGLLCGLRAGSSRLTSWNLVVSSGKDKEVFPSRSKKLYGFIAWGLCCHGSSCLSSDPISPHTNIAVYRFVKKNKHVFPVSGHY